MSNSSQEQLIMSYANKLFFFIYFFFIIFFFLLLLFFVFKLKLIVRHIFEHYHHSYYSWNIREARKNLQYLYRKPGWGQDNQQLPHKASILQVLDWRVGNTTNKAHHHFLFCLFSIRFIYF